MSTGIVDTFESLIWTDRYCGFGDFELYTVVSDDMMSLLQTDRYLWFKDSEYVMIIEDVRITSDVENGNRLTVSGRSLESILERRIVWTQTILSGNFQNGIKKLLDENIISPTDTTRQISNFIFEESIDTEITSLTVDCQFYGDNLYDTICSLCESNNIGFKITLNDNDQFVFKLYYGADRSYDQIVNPYVVFSPNFDNLRNTNYLESTTSLKTVSLVAGEGEGSAQKTTTAVSPDGAGEGLTRREMYTDASSVSSTTESGTLSNAQYLAQLEQKGSEDLAANVETISFDGQIESTNMYVYGQDYFMGDIIQMQNEYGIEAKVRVVELIRSQSVDSIELYPTFTTI
ncbi:siphovirus ReqiPepy6 Gp37-like family protein [Bacteroides sp.]|uniref:siphovirus ReqiPepy6 Gp37-like family protein n=1 Tax=Bacteroides sp. TaxID=29523 RepID=UPI00262D72B2|nr:siphovirus ReqiPepy6 Gp37-like family protein [Bacteroides sp.]MDD3040086.1 siphovirus ReqiPepy6 Gp37-like family protein [Bacteroides sp.]